MVEFVGGPFCGRPVSEDDLRKLHSFGFIHKLWIYSSIGKRVTVWTRYELLRRLYGCTETVEAWCSRMITNTEVR